MAHTQTLTLRNPTLPPGSTILVTGANGLIASHIVDQFLRAGYNVRGTVRNPSKCAWMAPLYERRHGPNRFQLVHVSDFDRPDCWDSVLQDVKGVAHIAGGADLALTDVEKAVEKEWKLHEGILNAAKKVATVKAFVLNGSAWAMFTPDAKKKEHVTEWTWNEEAVRIAKSDQPAEEKGLAPFMAVKMLLEKKVWEWIESENPGFAFNSVQLDTIMGECLDPEHQGIPSTAGMVKHVWDGTMREFLGGFQPQWHIDTRDAGMLFVAIMTTPGVDRSRILGFGEKFGWAKVARIIQELYPERKVGSVTDLGDNPSEVDNQDGAELLRKLGQPGWTSLRDSVRANVESILLLEQKTS